MSDAQLLEFSSKAETLLADAKKEFFAELNERGLEPVKKAKFVNPSSSNATKILLSIVGIYFLIAAVTFDGQCPGPVVMWNCSFLQYCFVYLLLFGGLALNFWWVILAVVLVGYLGFSAWNSKSGA